MIFRKFFPKKVWIILSILSRLESRCRWNGERLKRFGRKLEAGLCGATRWQISTRRGRLPSRLPFANFTTVIWRSLGYLLLGMATRKTHGFHAREREREDKRERGKFDFTSEKDYLGRLKAVGIRLPWTCSREKRKKDVRRKVFSWKNRWHWFFLFNS